MVELTQEDINSPVYKKLAKHFEEKLSAARRSNDQANDIVETSYTRGRIYAYKEFLKLNKEWKE